MIQVIIEVISDGWAKNLPVCKVIKNIASATGLSLEYARDQFAKYVFASKPEDYETDR